MDKQEKILSGALAVKIKLEAVDKSLSNIEELQTRTSDRIDAFMRLIERQEVDV
jgi:hypothetical protein